MGAGWDQRSQSQMLGQGKDGQFGQRLCNFEMDVNKVSTHSFGDGAVGVPAAGQLLALDWLRRDKNQLADDLSNMKFEHFDLGRRVRWIPQEQRWHVYTRFMQHAKEFHEEMNKRKSEDKPDEPAKKKVRTGGLGPW